MKREPNELVVRPDLAKGWRQSLKMVGPRATAWGLPFGRIDPMGNGRGGRTWYRIKDIIYRQEVCFRCKNSKGPVYRGPDKKHPLRPTVDHIKELADYPELAEEMSNLVMSHSTCNLSAGASFGNRRRAAAKVPRPASRGYAASAFPGTGAQPKPVPAARKVPRAKDCGTPGCRAWAGGCECS